MCRAWQPRYLVPSTHENGSLPNLITQSRQTRQPAFLPSKETDGLPYALALNALNEGIACFAMRRGAKDPSQGEDSL